MIGNGKSQVDLEGALAALRRDYSKMSPRVRAVTHTVVCECDGVTLRLHFPAIRQGQATMSELVDAIAGHLLPFALPRTRIAELEAQYEVLPMDEFIRAYDRVAEEARRIFMLANANTHRNGEAGELLLYVLTEWVLAAPQIIAKMSLKTNRDMPVYGADGVHARYCGDTRRLLLYWGESKLHAKVSDAITDAVKSIVDALDPNKMQHEIDLVQRNIDLSGLDREARDAFLLYLDPFEENYNSRHDVSTCLIGFDFDGFGALTRKDGENAEETFASLARARLQELAPQVARKMKEHGIGEHPVELFFFPIPSVDGFRTLFQNKIGWRK